MTYAAPFRDILVDSSTQTMSSLINLPVQMPATWQIARPPANRGYQVLLLDASGCVVNSVQIACATDDDAWTQARRGLEPIEEIEVWNLGRLVGRGDALARHTWR